MTAVTSQTGFVKNACFSIKSFIDTDGEAMVSQYADPEQSELINHFKVCWKTIVKGNFI